MAEYSAFNASIAEEVAAFEEKQRRSIEQQEAMYVCAMLRFYSA